MKPIVSNPKGFHIHSPSAFHLVTEVIFNPLTPVGLPKQQQVEWQKKSPFSLLVLKLASHFKPGRVVCIGHEAAEFLKKLQPSGIPVKAYRSVDEDITLTHHSEFVMWLEVPHAEFIMPDDINDCVWFVPGLERKEMREYFTMLKKNVKVSQSFELKHCGFVIFNSKLQKEDYIIKNRGFLIDL